MTATDMMTKTIFTIVLTAYAVTSLDYHDTLDDKIVFEDLPSSEIKDFLYCLLDKGPCTDVVLSYKKHYPTFLQELCSRCSKCQLHMLYVFLNRIRLEFPEGYQEYRAKFDPENKYYDKVYAKALVEKDKSYC